MSSEEEIIEADKAFSEYSVKNGLNAAFKKFSHPEAVLLRDSSMPVEGSDKLAKLFSGNDSNTVLSWEPIHATISESGELGYTYGKYDRYSKDRNKHDYGTYVTIWKKDNEGNWKWILDSGNQGIKRKK